jgi:5-formyltetrahydrofolate cyclo-ligase
MAQAQLDARIEKLKKKIKQNNKNYNFATLHSISDADDDNNNNNNNNAENIIKLTRAKSLKIYFSKNLGTNTIGLFYNAAPRKAFVITPRDWSIILENKNIINLHLNHGFD